MKRKVIITVGALLIIAVALVWLGNYRNAPAVIAQTSSNLTELHAADISAYRWEAMAKAYESRQGSPVQDSSIFSATDKYVLDTYGISPGREVQNEAAVPTVNSLDGTDKYNVEYLLDIYGMAQMDETAAEEDGDKDKDKPSDPPALATAKASAKLTNQPGRAIVSARGNHFIVDSVPPIGGPNQELNPLDMILGSLATCGLFIAERVGQEQAITLEDIQVAVEADLDASGVAGSGADPRLQAIRVHLELPGADDEQASVIVDNFMTRCPIYTTLSRAADIEITVGDEVPSDPTEGLNTASVSAQLSNQPGRAIVSARGNHFVIDSVPPLEGPNEERNPLDLLLGALATCGTFIFERSAEEMNYPVTSITTGVEGDFDPRGVASQDSGINPRLQAFRINIEVDGVNRGQAEQMKKEFQQRCPVYTTLERSAPIDISLTTNK